MDSTQQAVTPAKEEGHERAGHAPAVVAESPTVTKRSLDVLLNPNVESETESTASPMIVSNDDHDVSMSGAEELDTPSAAVESPVPSLAGLTGEHASAQAAANGTSDSAGDEPAPRRRSLRRKNPPASMRDSDVEERRTASVNGTAAASTEKGASAPGQHSPHRYAAGYVDGKQNTASSPCDPSDCGAGHANHTGGLTIIQTTPETHQRRLNLPRRRQRRRGGTSALATVSTAGASGSEGKAGSETGTAAAGKAADGTLKKRRRRVTPEQLHELTAAFEHTDTPGWDLRETLAARLGMTNREVQNRRAKMNRLRAREEQERQERLRRGPGPQPMGLTQGQGAAHSRVESANIDTASAAMPSSHAHQFYRESSESPGEGHGTAGGLSDSREGTPDMPSPAKRTRHLPTEKPSPRASPAMPSRPIRFQFVPTWFTASGKAVAAHPNKRDAAAAAAAAAAVRGATANASLGDSAVTELVSSTVASEPGQPATAAQGSARVSPASSPQSLRAATGMSPSMGRYPLQPPTPRQQSSGPARPPPIQPIPYQASLASARLSPSQQTPGVQHTPLTAPTSDELNPSNGTVDASPAFASSHAQMPPPFPSPRSGGPAGPPYLMSAPVSPMYYRTSFSAASGPPGVPPPPGYRPAESLPGGPSPSGYAAYPGAPPSDAARSTRLTSGAGRGARGHRRHPSLDSAAAARQAAANDRRLPPLPPLLGRGPPLPPQTGATSQQAYAYGPPPGAPVAYGYAPYYARPVRHSFALPAPPSAPLLPGPDAALSTQAPSQAAGSAPYQASADASQPRHSLAVIEEHPSRRVMPVVDGPDPSMARIKRRRQSEPVIWMSSAAATDSSEEDHAGEGVARPPPGYGYYLPHQPPPTPHTPQYYQHPPPYYYPALVGHPMPPPPPPMYGQPPPPPFSGPPAYSYPPAEAESSRSEADQGDAQGHAHSGDAMSILASAASFLSAQDDARAAENAEEDANQPDGSDVTVSIDQAPMEIFATAHTSASPAPASSVLETPASMEKKPPTVAVTMTSLPAPPLSPPTRAISQPQSPCTTMPPDTAASAQRCHTDTPILPPSPSLLPPIGKLAMHPVDTPPAPVAAPTVVSAVNADDARPRSPVVSTNGSAPFRPWQ
ncbi:hypothetical protein THASP1DRAFT_23799 [Thamnocephalis sphaerospora]|uniref:Homeobox domain-containing protein n=1 Tax=Thamnocephalis sphaerospora TaxID=78915 RepID=A0A4P9XQ73_9FUNG|nr:hypothetical protein THASP1DRAFT_23799 [Thamnocephalis sphaerospora]|eukprot:RKP08168.1 hypothetical protein THASP1DRAFT_23799 [Thamnocephalis sphaerospora]